jgi:hypothetical protein
MFPTYASTDAGIDFLASSGTLVASREGLTHEALQQRFGLGFLDGWWSLAATPGLAAPMGLLTTTDCGIMMGCTLGGCGLGRRNRRADRET